MVDLRGLAPWPATRMGWCGIAVLLARRNLGLHLTVVLWPHAQVVFRTTLLSPTDWLLVALGAGVALLATGVAWRADQRGPLLPTSLA